MPRTAFLSQECPTLPMAGVCHLITQEEPGGVLCPNRLEDLSSLHIQGYLHRISLSSRVGHRDSFLFLCFGTELHVALAGVKLSGRNDSEFLISLYTSQMLGIKNVCAVSCSSGVQSRASWMLWKHSNWAISSTSGSPQHADKIKFCNRWHWAPGPKATIRLL